MIILDFDGTLVDLWPRYYAVFRDLTGYNNLKPKKYKLVKQLLVTDDKVADYLGISLQDDYFEQKRELLENDKYLALDKLFFTERELALLTSLNPIILTSRHNIDNFYKQLSVLGIKCPAYATNNKSKKNWILENFPSQQGIIIGDSITDLEVATLPNMKAWMVGYGLQTRKSFKTTGITFNYIASPRDLIYFFSTKSHNL